MYIFELYYRTKISPIGVLHHLGTVLIAQAAVAISFDFHHETDATIEFILCLVWGEPDVSCLYPAHSALTGLSRCFRPYGRIPTTCRHHPVPHLPREARIPGYGVPRWLHHSGRRHNCRDCRHNVVVR